jgi:glutamate formiminotransferase
MRLLTVPNWSFGRDKGLLKRFKEIMSREGVATHYCKSDVDHNRTVTAFSAEEDILVDTLFRLCQEAFETIDLNKHVGVHPRIGALDVCPFVLLKDASRKPEVSLMNAQAAAERTAGLLSATFGVPIFLYEKSERGRHEADLPSLRKGGFGGLAERDLRPDFGPNKAHERLGVTVLGVRDPLIAFNVNLAAADPSLAQELATEIRRLRTEGDERFLGVRALGFPLASVDQSQVSLNVTLPDLTPVDPIVEWIAHRAIARGIALVAAELVGVIRPTDVEKASRLSIKKEQIVE